MTPDKNQQRSSQSDQGQNEQVSQQTGSQYRPDWIIPGNDTASKTSDSSKSRKDKQQDSPDIPKDNDETLGIP